MTSLYLLALAVFVIVAAFWFIRQAGRDEGRAGAQRDQAKAGTDDARKANEARARVDALPDGAAADRLRDEWARD